MLMLMLMLTQMQVQVQMQMQTLESSVSTDSSPPGFEPGRMPPPVLALPRRGTGLVRRGHGGIDTIDPDPAS